MLNLHYDSRLAVSFHRTTESDSLEDHFWLLSFSKSLGKVVLDPQEAIQGGMGYPVRNPIKKTLKRERTYEVAHLLGLPLALGQTSLRSSPRNRDENRQMSFLSTMSPLKKPRRQT